MNNKIGVYILCSHAWPTQALIDKTQAKIYNTNRALIAKIFSETFSILLILAITLINFSRKMLHFYCRFYCAPNQIRKKTHSTEHEGRSQIATLDSLRPCSHGGMGPKIAEFILDTEIRLRRETRLQTNLSVHFPMWNDGKVRRKTRLRWKPIRQENQDGFFLSVFGISLFGMNWNYKRKRLELKYSNFFWVKNKLTVI